MSAALKTWANAKQYKTTISHPIGITRGISLLHLWLPTRVGAIQAVEKLWKSCRKAAEKLWESCGKAMEKLWKSCGKAAEKLWKSCGKAVEKLWKTTNDGLQ